MPTAVGARATLLPPLTNSQPHQAPPSRAPVENLCATTRIGLRRCCERVHARARTSRPESVLFCGGAPRSATRISGYTERGVMCLEDVRSPLRPPAFQMGVALRGTLRADGTRGTPLRDVWSMPAPVRPAHAGEKTTDDNPDDYQTQRCGDDALPPMASNGCQYGNRAPHEGLQP